MTLALDKRKQITKETSLNKSDYSLGYVNISAHVAWTELSHRWKKNATYLSALEKYVGIIRHCISKEIDALLDEDREAYKRPTTPRTMFMEALLFDTMSAENILTLRTAYQDLLGLELADTDIILKVRSSDKLYHALNEQTMYRLLVANASPGWVLRLRLSLTGIMTKTKNLY